MAREKNLKTQAKQTVKTPAGEIAKKEKKTSCPKNTNKSSDLETNSKKRRSAPQDKTIKQKSNEKAISKGSIQSSFDSSLKNSKLSNVVYIGRIPHGFYEYQMRSFLIQFGSVVNLRISRNKKTGNSKHYGFVQFESAEVAKIVAEAMNNHLLCGNLLQCHVVPVERIHESLFRGANRHFRSIPWDQIHMQKHNAAVDRRMSLLGKSLDIPSNDIITDDKQDFNYQFNEECNEEEEMLKEAFEIIEPSKHKKRQTTNAKSIDEEKETALSSQYLENRKKRIAEKIKRRNECMNKILSA